MELVDIVFNKNKPFTPIRISGGSTNGRIMSQSEKLFEARLEASEKEALEEEVKLMRRNLNQNIKQSCAANQNLADGEHQNDEIYKKYNFGHTTQKATQLPVHASKGKILSRIAEYQSVVIEGSTGCGKSTQVSIWVIIQTMFSGHFQILVTSISQVPQLILDDAKENGKPCNIVVTQPRRIAARSIADQVCRERDWELGSIVGYQVSLFQRQFIGYTFVYSIFRGNQTNCASALLKF